MNRAYSILTAKAVQDGDERVIEGIASTPSPDRMGDVVEPLGAKFALPLPLLWQHNHDEPVGTVEFAEPNAKGIPFRARLAKVDEPGAIKDLVDKAWQAVKAGLVRGVSIGFASRSRPDQLKDGGLRFKDWEWLELSLVTIPANAEATISAIKSISRQQIAASGDGENHPGVSGTPVKLSIKEGPKMALAEQIASLEAKRAANAARMEEVATKSIDRGETMAADEQEEFDGLEAEVKQIDADLTRLRALERVKMATAKPAAGSKAADGMSRDPGTVPASVRVGEKLDKGIAFARLARVKALAKLDGESVSTVAKNLYGEDSSVYRLVTKAPVPAGTTLDGSWAHFLVSDNGPLGDFIEYLRPRTIIGRFGEGNIPSLRRVPFHTDIGRQLTEADAYWVGQGKAKPLTMLTGDRIRLDIFKVASIIVVTEELLRRSDSSAEAYLRDELTAAIAKRLDIDFIDPAKTLVPGVSPGSITNGAASVASSGTDADSVRRDAAALMNLFSAANNTPDTGVWIMGGGAAIQLAYMTNPLGQTEFNGMTINGGMFMGLPAIVSNHVPAGVVVLANAADIYLADEGGVTVDMSREASLEMATNPTHDSSTPTPVELVSLWQTNSVGFRAERHINWARRRPAAVAYLTGVNWGAPDTP